MFVFPSTYTSRDRLEFTGVVPNRRKLAGEQSFIDNVPKHVGHTKVTTAPVSRGARPESLNLHLEEPPDIKEMVNDAVHKAMDVEAMKKNLLLVGAIKDEDIRKAELDNDISYVSDACNDICLLYTSPSPRDLSTSRMPSSA